MHGRLRVGWRALAIAIAASLVLGEVAGAQATPILLQLRPKPGDTLRLRIDQTIEMGRATRAASEDSLVTQMTTLVILSRLAVESSDAAGTTVLAHTDSVRIESNDAYQSAVLRAARGLQGQRFRFRVAADGATQVSAGDAWAAPAVGTFLSQLPATLPREAVAPGGTWSRTVDIPLAVAPDGRTNATLTATFRFDSLSRSGEFAYLSIRGRLMRSGPMQESAGGGYVQTSGSVTGNILLDRRRGWIADARTSIVLRSLLSPKGRNPSPVRIRMKITQWMRVL